MRGTDLDRRSFLTLAGGLAAALTLVAAAPAEAMPLDRAPSLAAEPDTGEAKPEKAYWVWRRRRRWRHRRRYVRRYY